MIVFLFGAGASAGAGAILPERPPLGASCTESFDDSAPVLGGHSLRIAEHVLVLILDHLAD
jgi:hypothetical protein